MRKVSPLEEIKKLNTSYWEMARYKETGLDIYDDHPLIMAFPKILSQDEVKKELANFPNFHEEDKDKPSELRMHLIYSVTDLFIPNQNHIDLENKISLAIRAGYRGRNPFHRKYWFGLEDLAKVDIDFLPENEVKPLLKKTIGMYFVGISGIGKTTTINLILQLYQQVIPHREFRGRRFTFLQLTWLIVETPSDGTIKSLLHNCFKAVDRVLGTDFYSLYTENGTANKYTMKIKLKTLFGVLGIGILCFDEVQHLLAADKDELIDISNFFVELENVMEVPLVLIGTYQALPFLQKNLRTARRGSGQGDLVWERMKEPTKIWSKFVDELWKYQYLHEFTPLTTELSHILYYLSQGITDFAVKVFLLTQMRAIVTMTEKITKELMVSVAADSLKFAHEILEALRNNDWKMLQEIDDVGLIDMGHYYDEMQAALQENEIAYHTVPVPDVEVVPPSQTPILKEAAKELKPDPNQLSPNGGKKERGKRKLNVPNPKSCVHLLELFDVAEKSKKTPYLVFKEAGICCSIDAFISSICKDS